MIRHIYIKDYVLIEELSLDTDSGFLAITGETGAGKSILIGALGLVSGNRAESRAVREGSPKAIVELTCDIADTPALRDLFDTHELDYEPVCTLRREITSAGKSRAFINDTPVATSVMKAIGEHLIDIHSQHHNMLIGDPDFQMSVVDTLAGNTTLLEEYKAAYRNLLDARHRLEEERDRIASLTRDVDYIQFQYSQLVEAAIRPGELEDIEERLAMAHNAQGITEALTALLSLGAEEVSGTPAPLDRISSTTKMLGKLSGSYPPAAQLYERLNTIRVELIDLSGEAESLLGSLSIDEGEIEALEARIDLLQSLLFKHKLKTSDELIALREEYATYLNGIDTADERIAELEREVQRADEEAHRLAQILTEKRREVSTTLLPDLDRAIKELGITGATFSIDLQPTEALTPLGGDKIAFLFATNKQTLLRPIREIASGGEISRFMLALKSILASRTVLPTVVFDEIDTGVSGEVASKLGEMMRALSRNLQVITITHLPQIAALADHQYVVSKREGDTSFVTSICKVEGESRVEELAGMLSGSEITAAAIENARSLLYSIK